MSYNLESFCPEVWSQIEIDAEGDYKVCCLANHDKDFGMALDDNNKVMNVLTHSIQEALNSKTHREHRIELSKNIKPTRCRNCYDSEAATKRPSNIWGSSKRQRVINITAASIPEHVTIDNVEQYTNADGTVTSKVVNLDLRFGNLCNYKCIMCSPQHSNLWYDDWVALDLYGDQSSEYRKGEAKVYPITKDEHGRSQMEGMTPWWESDIWWERFDEIAPDLRYIYFTGGEPLLVPQMQECLDKLISRGFAKNIQLRYDTNLSVINHKVINKWKHFKNIYLCVSIDDVDDRYNLIRNPGNFSKFLANIKLLQENNIPIHYASSCVGMASIYNMTRVIPLMSKLGIRTEFRFLEGPGYLDIRYLPKTAKLEIIEKLSSIAGPPEHQVWYNAEINLLKKYIDSEDPSKIQKFVRVMNKLDELRNTNWRVTLDDVYDLLKRHCGII
jgi:organic radical activating enzyme